VYLSETLTTPQTDRQTDSETEPHTCSDHVWSCQIAQHEHVAKLFGYVAEGEEGGQRGMSFIWNENLWYLPERTW